MDWKQREMFLNGSPEVKQAIAVGNGVSTEWDGSCTRHLNSWRYERVGGKEKKGFCVILKSSYFFNYLFVYLFWHTLSFFLPFLLEVCPVWSFYSYVWGSIGRDNVGPFTLAHGLTWTAVIWSFLREIIIRKTSLWFWRKGKKKKIKKLESFMLHLTTLIISTFVFIV